MPGFRALFIAFFALSGLARAATRVESAPVPPEMLTSFFAITVNNQPVDVAHAASNYEFASFDTTGPVEIAITAAEPGFWDGGVDIEPWRLGLRAAREGQTIRFRLTGPAKLAISRPGDFLNDARMLFLFAGTPPPPAPAGPNVTVVPAGVHRESLNPKSGETIYLAPGAFIFGSLNLWNVENVKVLGRGTIVYDGPQNPADDEGWMQKPDWHCIGANQARNVEIDGLTCIVRSRTWQIQMKDSYGFRFDDLRVIGGNTGNANQDGMDWLGGGDTVVRNAFFRASDDDLAMLGNWDGYSEADIARPGKDVENITVEDSEFSTSISNTVRAGWPGKVFNSRNFTLRNSDVLHGGIGACGQDFALFDLWGAEGAAGEHSGFAIENITLDNWYSLAQIEQDLPEARSVVFRNIWALDQPPLAASTLAGDVKDVTLDNVKYGQRRVNSAAEVPLTVNGGAEQPTFTPAPALVSAFTIEPQTITPHKKVTFAATDIPGAEYTWLFGDGTTARGRRVWHRFPDALGTELDGKNGAGRFRVLLHVTAKDGSQDWASQGVVVVDRWFPAQEDAAQNGAALHGFFRVPADGGYTFHLIDRDGARLMIDGVEVAKTGPPFPQVCGTPGNALRYSRGAIGLRAGLHAIRVETSDAAPRLLWEGPGVPLTEIAPEAYGR